MRRAIALAAVAAAFAAPAQASAASAAAVDAGASTEASASGCRTVDIAQTGKDIFGFVVYRFHQVKRWCWTYPRITSVNVSTYVSDVDPNMQYDGIVASTGWYYAWCCGNGKSGHYSLRQGKFKNCILWFPCSRVEYPWVRIWAHADGSYSWTRGVV